MSKYIMHVNYNSATVRRMPHIMFN